jgi:hypothetical protein
VENVFYNSKKLIDEKVLQQYYFESFMLADASTRKKLLPPQFQKEYSPTGNVKGLHPEVTLGQTSKKTYHKTDFVLYPTPGKSLDKLNIEIKWSKEDFENQPERFDYYNGTKGLGFVVCMDNTDTMKPNFIFDKKLECNTAIPIVYLDVDSFKKWFSIHSYDIVSQALSNKLGIAPARLTGTKYWVIVIGSLAKKHYFEHGRTHGIWAFRDNKTPKNIMKILKGDYVTFVHFQECNPPRMIYPEYSEPKKIHTVRGATVLSSDIYWSISNLDIFEVSKGYHLDFTNNDPYSGFDEEWVAKSSQIPEEKEYTQFIRMDSHDTNDPFQYFWVKSTDTVLERKHFPSEDMRLVELVNALRNSSNTAGDAVEISRTSFEAMVQLLSQF